MSRRLRRWLWRFRLYVRYLTLNEDERQEFLALLRRQAWQARLLAGEAKRLAAEGKRLVEQADSAGGSQPESDETDQGR